MEETQTAAHVIEQADLDLNPELVTAGIKVGDEIQLPVPTELDVAAGKIHAEMLAQGKTMEEANEVVEKFYAANLALEVTVSGLTAEASVVETTVAEEVTPDAVIVGKVHEGVTVVSYRYVGGNLVVMGDNGAEFTIPESQVAAFLK